MQDGTMTKLNTEQSWEKISHHVQTIPQMHPQIEVSVEVLSLATVVLLCFLRAFLLLIEDLSKFFAVK
jgi:hypothetical protein